MLVSFLKTQNNNSENIMNFIFLIVIIYSLGIASTKDVTYGGAMPDNHKRLTLREQHLLEKDLDTGYNELLQEYPHRERAKNFVFHAQSQIKTRDVTDEDTPEPNVVESEETVLETSTVAEPMYSDLRNRRIVLYSKKSWIKDFLSLNKKNDDTSAQSVDDNTAVDIDVDLLIEYLMTQGFTEEDLQFLKTNLDYGFDEIERELRKIKDNTQKNKHISIGGEDGKEDGNGKDNEDNNDNSPKSNSNSLKTSFKILCLTFIFVTYII